jgi:hypothetical protein
LAQCADALLTPKRVLVLPQKSSSQFAVQLRGRPWPPRASTQSRSCVASTRHRAQPRTTDHAEHARATMPLAHYYLPYLLSTGWRVEPALPKPIAASAPFITYNSAHFASWLLDVFYATRHDVGGFQLPHPLLYTARRPSQHEGRLRAWPSQVKSRSCRRR